MTTFTELFHWVQTIFTSIWDGIFSVEIFGGLTFKVLIVGFLMIMFSVGILKFFISNTHSDPGIASSISSEVRSFPATYYYERPGGKHARSRH